MKYLGDLGVKLDEAAVLAVLTELSAPTMGEFTREGFINGWTNHRYDTPLFGLVFRQDYTKPCVAVPKPSQSSNNKSNPSAAPSNKPPTSSKKSTSKPSSSPASRVKKSFPSKSLSSIGASSSPLPHFPGTRPRPRGWNGGSSISRRSGRRASARICGIRRARSCSRVWAMRVWGGGAKAIRGRAYWMSLWCM